MTENGNSECCGPGYASPAEAMKAPREKLLYTGALFIGTGIQNGLNIIAQTGEISGKN